jgi:hypothetical protein
MNKLLTELQVKCIDCLVSGEGYKELISWILKDYITAAKDDDIPP